MDPLAHHLVVKPEITKPAVNCGWLATKDRDLLAGALSYKDYTTICGSAPSEVLAIIALRAKDRVVARTRSSHNAPDRLSEGQLSQCSR